MSDLPLISGEETDWRARRTGRRRNGEVRAIAAGRPAKRWAVAPREIVPTLGF